LEIKAMFDDLNKVERQVFQSSWDDGLLDLFAALGVLSIGAFWLFEVHVGAAIVPALLVPLWAPFRQKFIEPRMGYVEFSDARESRSRRMLWQVFAVGVAMFVLGVGVFFLVRNTDMPVNISWIAALPAFLLALMGVFATLLISTPRFLVNPAVLVAAGLIGAINGWRPGPILTLAGGVMTVIAIYLVLRFLQVHPRNEEPRL